VGSLDGEWTGDRPTSLGHSVLPFRIQQGIIDSTMPTRSTQTKWPALLAGWPLVTFAQELGAFAQSLDALGTKVLADLPTALKDLHALDISPKLPSSPHVRVAHIVPKTGRLAAMFAFCHCSYPLESSPSRGLLQRKGDHPGRQR
jgi:hypothetical protein